MAIDRSFHICAVGCMLFQRFKYNKVKKISYDVEEKEYIIHRRNCKECSPYLEFPIKVQEETSKGEI